MSGADAHWMGEALALAEAALGTTWPNPAVGCVLVKDGRKIAEAATARGGRPHAEWLALQAAGEAARGATAYVTLEPCAHRRAEGPCAEALARAGVARVVVALTDPDPRVNGQGSARLRAAGIEVEIGEGGEPACAVNAGHLKRIRQGLPWCALKLAQSLDGRIATASGESRWITGEAARAEGHRLRATHDAILAGSGTALADDPLLTCRLPGLEDRSPVRVIADRRLRLPLDSRLVATARTVPVWILTAEDAPPEKVRALEAAGCELIALPAGDGALRAGLARLAERGITRLLVEGGAGLAAALLRDHLIDRLYLFTAPLLLGAEGLASVGELRLGRLGEAQAWRRGEERALGNDRLSVLDAAG